MNDVDFPVARVLDGIDAAADGGPAGEGQRRRQARRRTTTGLVDLARHFRGTGHAIRFIEFMDVGATNGWRLDDVVPAAEIVRRDRRESSRSSRSRPRYRGEVARRWRYRDGAGEIGVIASVTQPFCGDCTRARISAEGKLYTCLFAVRGTDLRAAPAVGRERRRAARARSPRSGNGARTATRSCAASRQRPRRRSRCPTSAASVAYAQPIGS